MQIEPYPSKDGFRCWLNPSEEALLLEQVEEEPEKDLALRSMLHGLRADELEHVCTDNLRELDSEDSAYKLRVRSGKTGWREVPVSTELVQRMKMLKNVRSAHADEELISVHKGSVQRWVRNIAQDLAETHNDDWQYLTAHDLRRTWATRTYYALDSHHAVDLIMRWGGWDSRDVFTQNYLGRESDEMAASMMQSLGMLG